MKELKILFPTDFSPASSRALRYVLQFADSAYTSMEMIHMMGNPVQSLESSVVVVEATKTQLDYSKKQIRKQFNDAMIQIEMKGMLDHIPEIDFTLEYGDPKGFISSYQKINEFDLLAIGTTGEGKKTFGSFTSNLLRRVSCNVLVIPNGSEYKDIRTIVFATDFNDSDPYYIAEMLRVVEPFEPTIHCVHIKGQKEQKKGIGKEGLINFIRENFPMMDINVHEIEDKNIETGIKEFADNVNAQMIAMVAPKYSVLKTMLHKSHTKKMAGITELPLLVLKER